MEYNIKRILVPVDLSQTSLNAVDAAIYLAKENKATIQLLHVTENNSLSAEIQSQQAGEKAEAVLNALAAAIAHTSQVATEMIEQQGNVSDTIIQGALLNGADLIVMGTHAASGYRIGFVGSNAYRVVKQASCPVLLVPPSKKWHSFSKVLFPIRPVTGALTRFDIVQGFLAPEAAIDVLGISWQQELAETSILEKIIDEVRPMLDANKVQAAWGRGFNCSDDVLYHAQQATPDLIVLTAGMDASTKINFIGPHAQRIINCAKAPVLVIKRVGVPMMA